MDNEVVREEFEKIVINDQIKTMDRDLGYASASARLDTSSIQSFEKFLNPDSAPLPDIDGNFVNTPNSVFGEYLRERYREIVDPTE